MSTYWCGDPMKEEKGQTMHKEYDLVDINKLHLDPDNPRLPESLQREQQSMLDYIAETTSIEELMAAIGENGFFLGEPLIVIPDPNNGDEYFVVEGNRRLTAVKLLSDPHLCSRPGTKMFDISKTSQHKPTKIPVVIRKTRGEVLPYLGFRHITGIKQWEPLAKARYLKQLFDLNGQETPSERYVHVSQTIGSRPDFIKRNLDALAIFRIIEDAGFYNINGLDDKSIKFAVLSTAVADTRIGEFVGVKTKTPDGDYLDTNPTIDPSLLHREAIEDLTRWLFEKDSNGKTKVVESRNIRFLSAIVNSPKALNAMRSGAPIMIAYQLTSDWTRNFSEILYQVEALLSEASSMVANVDYEDDTDKLARRILENVKMIVREIRDKNRLEDDDI